MENLLIDELLQALSIENVDSTVIHKIKLKMLLIVSNYDVTKKTTQLIPYNYVQTPIEVIEYLTYLKVSGLSMKTLKNYELELRLFYRSINIHIRSVTHPMILLYLYNCQSKNKVSDVTVEHKRIVIHSFYHWMLLEQYIESDPSCRIKPIKCIKKILDPLSNLELEQIRLSSSDIREQCLIEVLYSTGMRVSELCSVNISMIDFYNKKAIILGKGNKERIIRFSNRAILLIQQYINFRCDDNDALFVSCRKPYQRLSKAGIEYIVHQIASLAGVTRISVTPHTFRRNHGLSIYNKTKDIYQAAESLGHANISTTTRYIKLSQQAIQQTYDFCMN